VNVTGLAATGAPVVGGVVAAVESELDPSDDVFGDCFELLAASSSSPLHAASSAVALVSPTPRRPSRRSASRRETNPAP
jgi:hypothetical protein